MKSIREEDQKKSIKEWAEQDRPREKLFLKGPGALSESELLAIIMGSGSRSESAVDLAMRILASVSNNVAELSRLSISDLTKFKGVGPAKAITIVAAIELGKRRQQSEILQRKTITSSRDVFEIMQPLLGYLTYEEFWIITLNRSNKVKRTICISEGGIEGTVADPKKIFKLAIDDNASSVILCHNHPSGALIPSENDKNITRKCKEAGTFLDLKVIDHLIIANNEYFSFADNGVL
ncbi:MAG TPA: DNA repair protein RadC [Bacteroidales bacterium]|nr:DNA repair protein RadC [Bacteroidales bacterium]